MWTTGRKWAEFELAFILDATNNSDLQANCGLCCSRYPSLQVASKPLVASVTSSTASTRAKQAHGASVKSTGTISKSTSGALSSDARQPSKPLKAPLPKGSEPISKSTSTHSVPSPSEAAPKAPTPAPKQAEDTTLEATPSISTDTPKEVIAPELSTSSVKPPAAAAAPPPQNLNEEKAPVPTSDPLQKDLAARAQQLNDDESGIKDQKTRVQAEQAAEFYDALSTDAFAQTAPRIMQAFLAHGEVCERAEASAMQLALQGAPPAKNADDEEDGDWDAPLRVYAEMLDTLEALHTEAQGLEASIVKLAGTLESEIGPQSEGPRGPESGDEAPGADEETNGEAESGAQAQIIGVFQACLPVLRARIANLAMAQELVDGAQENVSISLRMESLGLLE
ncbi:hypothetical protein DXG01_001573 [Tephrocybe rancida]|nr:hypothetical protein DXG01_001573 [Tephrocybe rancida]